MHYRHDSKEGMCIKSTNVKAIYRVFRADENTIYQASIKAFFARIGVPMFYDPDISWCTGVWTLMIRFADGGRRT